MGAGAGLCCFERFKTKRGEVRARVRVLKITQPVKCVIEGYDGHIPPLAEGGLLKKLFGTKLAMLLLEDQ